MNITLNKTKTLVSTYRVGTAIQNEDTWQLISALIFESVGDGWVWSATTNEVTEEEAAAVNAPRTAAVILAEQAVLIGLMSELCVADQITAQNEIDETNAAIEDENMVAAEEHEGILRTLVRENLLCLSEE